MGESIDERDEEGEFEKEAYSLWIVISLAYQHPPVPSPNSPQIQNIDILHNNINISHCFVDICNRDIN